MPARSCANEHRSGRWAYELVVLGRATTGARRINGNGPSHHNGWVSIPPETRYARNGAIHLAYQVGGLRRRQLRRYACGWGIAVRETPVIATALRVIPGG